MPETIRPPVWFALALLTLGTTGAVGADGVGYNRDVRPLLAETCFRCHGPGVKKAGLRLDRPDDSTKPAASGATPIIAGKVDDSEAIRRIMSDDPGEVMPPPSAKKPLSPAQKDLLKRWVAAGARYEPHWAFQTPVSPPLPKTAAGVNPVDAFLNDRLAREGLKPNAEADRPTLVRRVSFALTGLPPTLAEVDDYIGDASSRAYENMVERYLHSPRYGEEMARHWLDAARYADTHGLHLDNERQMWLYRDWVVRAFNDNKPFDEFTTEQLAGDLLPDPTPDRLVATGFSRCNVTTGEGGSIEQEWVFRNAVDRASTTAETWLGLTAGCAVCHDHKFDPIPQRDFYALYAFFYSAAGPALDGNVALHEPTVRVATPEQDARVASLTLALNAARAAVDRAYDALTYEDPSTPRVAGPSAGSDDPSRSFRAWVARLDDAAVKAAPASLKPLLTKARKSAPAGDDEKALRAYYLKSVCVTTKDAFAPLLAAAAKAEAEKMAADAEIPRSYVFRETGTPRDAFVMFRGQYDKPGEKVPPGTFTALPALKKADPSARATRLDLARWLTSPEQPLTSRVAVNRVWQQFFGTGLVKTAADFGTQGDPPSHPDLLDWLATSFRQSGWDTRALVRRIVTSEAFKRSSVVTPEQLQRDPENRMLARGPRPRLDAEQVRDNALAVGGLLNTKMGGRGVRPYQPPNIWEPVAFTGSNTRAYVQDHGPDLYRRSLYTFLKRTAPAPFMANFDAPSREAFCSRRERSNTPLQALQLMNDTQHVEAARALATRVLVEAGETTAARVDHAVRIVLARRAEPEEVTIISNQLAAHLARYQADPAAASALIRVGETPLRAGLPAPELAAWTLLANTLLNLDETVTRN